ncbi:hypothetical protein CJ030_MR2G013454 [Morella rubra]|uniref:PB1-like domain-containing protein n=1 Tax=Morella rubra TaxID=262757 RepID=A0A6A1WBC9_9ROSI|nr:hypothetical protein CJ030_MR2G013454 [Morella rubra]
MVRLFLYHGGSMNFVKGAYVGGEVTFLGDLDPDFISVTHILKHAKVELKYNNVKRMCCKLGRDSFVDSMTLLHTDADVLKVIDRISHLKVRDDLHIYLEHDMDVPELVQPPLPLPPLPLDTGCGEGLGEDLGEGLGEGLRDGQGEGSVLEMGKVKDWYWEIGWVRAWEMSNVRDWVRAWEMSKGTPQNGETRTSQTARISEFAGAGTSQSAGVGPSAGTNARKRRGTQEIVQGSSQPCILPRRSPRKKSSAQNNREAEQPNVVTAGCSQLPTLPRRSPRKKSSTNPYFRATQ